ncbi:MAG: hypothetical protein Q8O67_27315 [Deltaproteobacteria bacterium]|nr:hypothetical protein [Deltaproteobacteria bacterium]
MKVVQLLVAAVLLATAPASAAGAAVFLNGVNIDGVTSQTFENCTVTIDEKGNVHIVAKGYEVQAAAPNKAKPRADALVPAEPVTKRFFLVSEQSVTGMAQYDIDVFINATWIKRIGADEPQVVLEISKHMHKGKNNVHFTATKNLKEVRKSSTPAHFVKVHIGEGNMGGNNVMIDNGLLEYTRTAAELQNFDEDFVVMGR